MEHTVATIDSSNLHKYVHNPLCASGPHKMVLLLTNGRKYKQRWQSFEWPFRCFVSNYNILIDLSGCEFSPKAVGLRPQKLAQSSTSSPHLQLQPLTDWLYKDSEISPPTLSTKKYGDLSLSILDSFVVGDFFKDHILVHLLIIQKKT